MARIYPFKALRPRDDLAGNVASVPYDVVDRDEARTLAQGNPNSFLHVTKPEIDLPDDVDPYDDRVYAQGATALRTFIDTGIMRQDRQPGLYAYALTMGEHTQTGVVLCASVDDYDRNIVRKHEFTRPDKENDRVRHMEALNAQSGTVFLVHKDAAAIDGRIHSITTTTRPSVDITAPDGVRHRLWVIDAQQSIDAIVQGFADLGPIYIADGHHRSAAASRVAASRRRPPSTAAEGREGHVPLPSDRFLAVSFPASQVQILPYNRVVKDLNGHSADAFLAHVAQRFELTEGKPAQLVPKQFAMFLAGRWYGLTVRSDSYDAADPVARLDVSILQEQLLAPVLGIADPRRDKRIDFVGGIRGDHELERRVLQQGWAVAFALHATAIDDLFAIADAGQVMPPKSTWFEPKLRDGLFVHLL